MAQNSHNFEHVAPLHRSWKKLDFKVTHIRHFLGLFSAIPPPLQKKSFFENMNLPFGGQIMDQFSPNLYHRFNYLTTFIAEKYKIFDHLAVPYHILFFPPNKLTVTPTRDWITPEIRVGGLLIRGDILSHPRWNLAIIIIKQFQYKIC